MSVSAVLTTSLTVTETPDVNVPFADASPANNRVVHDVLNESVTLNAGSTPAASQVAGFQKALSSGAATIDLTALVGTEGRAIDGTGLKVRMAKFRNPVANANPITLTFGASNAYLLLGSGWKIILAPGQSVTLYLKDGAPAIGSSTKAIDLAGTGAQALDCLLVLG